MIVISSYRRANIRCGIVLPHTRSSLSGDPAVSGYDAGYRIQSLAPLERENKEPNLLDWGSAPDPGIFQGMTPVVNNTNNSAPIPRENRGTYGTSLTHRRSGYPSPGCVPAVPDSVSPDNDTMYDRKLGTQGPRQREVDKQLMDIEEQERRHRDYDGSRSTRKSCTMDRPEHADEQGDR